MSNKPLLANWIAAICVALSACGSSNSPASDSGASDSANLGNASSDSGIPDAGIPDTGIPDSGGSCMAIADSTPTVCSMIGASRNVVFTNNCGVAVDIWWVTDSCTESFYWRLGAGMSYTQPSYVTHPWRARAVPPGPGAPGSMKGALIKEFGAIPAGPGDYSFAVP